MDKYFMWINYELLHNHNKAKHNKTVCIFLGIYCIFHDGFLVTRWPWGPLQGGIDISKGKKFNYSDILFSENESNFMSVPCYEIHLIHGQELSCVKLYCFSLLHIKKYKVVNVGVAIGLD